MVIASRKKTVMRGDRTLLVFPRTVRDAELIYSSIEHSFHVHNIHTNLFIYAFFGFSFILLSYIYFGNWKQGTFTCFNTQEGVLSCSFHTAKRSIL